MSAQLEYNNLYMQMRWEYLTSPVEMIKEKTEEFKAITEQIGRSLQEFYQPVLTEEQKENLLKKVTDVPELKYQITQS